LATHVARNLNDDVNLDNDDDDKLQRWRNLVVRDTRLAAEAAASPCRSPC